MKNLISNKKGFTLIELLAAILILSFVVLSLAILIRIDYKNNMVIKTLEEKEVLYDEIYSSFNTDPFNINSFLSNYFDKRIYAPPGENYIYYQFTSLRFPNIKIRTFELLGNKYLEIYENGELYETWIRKTAVTSF